MRIPRRSTRPFVLNALPAFNGTYRFRTAMNGIENSTRFAIGDGSGAGGREGGRGWDRDNRHRDWGLGKERKRIPLREWHFGRRGARHGGERCDTHAEIETGRGGKNKSTSRGREWCFNGAARLEQLLAEYCNHYVSISSPESLARLSPSRFKNDHDTYIRIQVYMYEDCRQNRPSVVPIENHSIECRQSKDREPVETDLSRPARWQRDR